MTDFTGKAAGPTGNRSRFYCGEFLPAWFDGTHPAIWIAEGLLMYLSSSDAEQFLMTITALSAPGSRLVGEYFSGPWQESDVETSDEQQHAAWDLVRQAFLYGPAGVGPAAWLAGHGWTSCQVTTITELGSRRRRQAPSEFARASAPRVWLFDGTLVRAPRRAVPARPAIKALFTTASRLSTWWIHTDAPRP